MARRQKNAQVALVLAGVVCGMVALSFAAVPLYRLFCQVTGFGGTTQVADTLPQAVAEHEVIVRFDSNVHPGLPWFFQPEVRQVKVKVGEAGLVYFKAKNLSNQRTVGTATFNVTPLDVGQYFNKVQCFCFNEQVLEPGQEVEMPVSFFVDPKLLDDRNMKGVKTITLSYTFFAAPDAEGETDEGETDRTVRGAGSAAAGKP